MPLALNPQTTRSFKVAPNAAAREMINTGGSETMRSNVEEVEDIISPKQLKKRKF